jgi:hypothetical protein
VRIVRMLWGAACCRGLQSAAVGYSEQPLQVEWGGTPPSCWVPLHSAAAFPLGCGGWAERKACEHSTRAAR